jgi:hypothetical protein
VPQRATDLSVDFPDWTASEQSNQSFGPLYANRFAAFSPQLTGLFALLSSFLVSSDDFAFAQQ